MRVNSINSHNNTLHAKRFNTQKSLNCKPKINFQDFDEKEEKKINQYSKDISEILKEKELENSLKNESIETFEEIKISKIENNNKDKKSGIQEDKKISIHKIKTNRL